MKTEDLNSLLDKLKCLNSELQQTYSEKYRKSKQNDMLDSYCKDNHINYRFRGGTYWNICNIPDYQTKWKNSFFDVQNLYIESLQAISLDIFTTIECNYKGNPFIQRELPYKANIIGYCDMVRNTSQGPIIRLSDPSGKYTPPPIKDIAYEDIYTMFQQKRIILMTLIIHTGKQMVNIKEFKPLNYQLFDKTQLKYS